MTRRRAHLFAAVAALALATAATTAPTAATAQTVVSPVKMGPPAGATTPRLPSGKPDLNGMWGGPSGDAGEVNFDTVLASRRCAPTQIDCTEQTNQGIDGEFTNRTGPSRPMYKPEFWDRIQSLDMNSNKEDPLFVCQAYGVPRVGPPARIIQNDTDIIFLYRSGGASTLPADYRALPIDGRPHDPVRALDVTFYGDSVGKWEGDVLVIDSVGLNDLTWMSHGGYFTSDQKHTIERLWREGNTLFYQVTVDDPGVLTEPWVMAPRQVNLNTSPKAYLAEGEPCKDYDLNQMSSQIRH